VFRKRSSKGTGFGGPDDDFQPSMSEHEREHQALTVTSGLLSSFLHPPSTPDGRITAPYTGFLTLAPLRTYINNDNVGRLENSQYSLFSQNCDIYFCFSRMLHGYP